MNCLDDLIDRIHIEGFFNIQYQQSYVKKNIVCHEFRAQSETYVELKAQILTDGHINLYNRTQNKNTWTFTTTLN
jgi:hypothetical protein